MSEQRGMPPWFFMVATIVSLLMVALYVRMTVEEGLSFWMVFRIVFWFGLLCVFVWMFCRARAVRRDSSQYRA
ncbi:MAG: hypothetical protein PVG79_01615 [Gemmatimonadales bacterium]|jgi:hypothetical protein